MSKKEIKRNYKKLISNIEELRKEQQEKLQKRNNKMFCSYLESQEDLEDIYYIDELISDNYNLIDELRLVEVK